MLADLDTALDTSPAIADLTDRIKAAAAARTPLRIRGGGTKDFYAQSLQGDVLDMTGLSGVTSYEPSELVVTALAGTPLAELEALLAVQGQCLPFEPPHFRAGATVGGMVAAGLSGPARASSGAVRDFMLGVRFVNGLGEHLTFGGQVMKNVAGYDVSRLMAGSMGTLGVITEVSLKVLPVPPAEATLRFDCSQSEALQWLHGWGGQPLPLSASCWLHEEGSDTGTLYLRLRGAVAAVQAACHALGKQAGATLEEPAQVAADWMDCRNQQLPWFRARRDTQDLWRLSVPQTAPVLALPESPLIEWHGGQRWVRADQKDADKLRQVAREAGGHATLFIAACASNVWAGDRFDALKPPLDRIHRNLKAQFDPAAIFNPNRMSRDF